MAGSPKHLEIYQNDSLIYTEGQFSNYGIWTDGNKIYTATNNTPQPGDTVLVTLTTTISGLYTPGIDQSNVGLNSVLALTNHEQQYFAVYCVNASNNTTLDLSTLSDISDGAHTVKVKAKASGYRDSEFSNEVSYTKSGGYTITFNIDYAFKPGNVHQTFVKVNTSPSSNTDYTIETLNGGEISGNNPVSGVTKLYVWGYGYKNIADEKILLNNSTYNNAVEIPVSSDGTFTVMCTGDI